VQLRPQLDIGVALTRQAIGDTLRASLGGDGFRIATLGTISAPFDRTAERARFQTAQIEQTRRAREAETIRVGASLAIRRSIRDHERATKALALAEATAELSRQEAEVARVRHDRGLSNNLDLVNAEAGLLEANGKKLAALADLALSRLVLAAALGTLDPRSIR
jgi:outer membrane protein TolC